MTVTVTTARVEYTGNGSTIAFTVPFYFLANGDLKVYQAGVLKTITTHYTVSGAGNPAGGTVTFGTAPATNEAVVIFRDPAITQSTDYTPNDPFPAESHERALDRLTMIAQRLDDRADRALTLADSDTSGAATTLPTPEASQLIGWNEDADALMNYDPADIASVVTYSNWKVQTFTGDGSDTSFLLTDSPVNVANTDVSIDGVTQVPGTDYALSGDGMSIVFGTAPGNGTVICVRYGQSAAQGRDDASIIYFQTAGTGAVSRSVQNKLREFVSVKDFGAVGDGTTDDTAAIQLALTAAAAKPVIFPAGTYKTTGALTYAGPQFYMEPGAAITPTGSAYTALTVNSYGFSGHHRIIITGDGSTANGLLLQNPVGATFDQIRVSGFDGYGVKINKCWDCRFDTISVEDCGNATDYAFSMNDDSDTCNMTNITRLQVENCTTKVIYISPNTLSCVIQNIHSEGAAGNGSDATWSLGGNRCAYLGGRFQASANAIFTTNASNTQFHNLLVESGGVDYIEWANGNASTDQSFYDCELQVLTRGNSGALGYANFTGCNITRLDTSKPHRLDGCRVGNLGISVTSGLADCVINNCTITRLYNAASCTATLRNNYITENDIGEDFGGGASGTPASLYAENNTIAGGADTYKINNWETITANLLNSWTDQGSGPSARVRQDGNRVVIEGRIKNGTTTNETEFLTVPARYRPTARKIGVAYVFEGPATFGVGGVLYYPTNGTLMLIDFVGNDDVNFRINYEI